MFWWVILGTIAVVLAIAWIHDRRSAGSRASIQTPLLARGSAARASNPPTPAPSGAARGSRRVVSQRSNSPPLAA